MQNETSNNKNQQVQKNGLQVIKNTSEISGAATKLNITLLSNSDSESGKWKIARSKWNRRHCLVIGNNETLKINGVPKLVSLHV